ncbi:MAG: hypothetical protein J6B29_05620 [Clostridia bacterium]|nr:hypothetical protein [Clostridia bacterium]
MKKIIKLLLALGTVLALVLTCACGDDTAGSDTTESSKIDTTPSSQEQTTQSSDNTTESSAPADTKVTYVIKATDYKGEQMGVSVLVEMFKDGESLGKKAIRRGSASFELEAGDYTFTLSPNSDTDKFYYDEDSCVLSAEDTEKTIVLYEYANSSITQQIWVTDMSEGHIDYDAVSIEEGASYITIDRAEMTYLIFTPTRGGMYRISFVEEENVTTSTVTLGYFGSPHSVWESSIADLNEDGSFDLKIDNSSVNLGSEGGTARFVIGVRSARVKGCVLMIERTGDVQGEMPWTEVQADKDAVKTEDYLNDGIVDFDITDASLSAVYNEDDGYYHLNSVDGPILYIRLNSAVIASQTKDEIIYKYFAPISSITATLGKIFYEGEGDDRVIVEKVRYNEMLQTYSELCGSKGIYPLNEQLAQAIKDIGDYNDWYSPANEFGVYKSHLAAGETVVSENAWLFACCYVDKDIYGESGKPSPITPVTAETKMNFSVKLENGEKFYIRTVKDGTFTMTNAQGYKLVANNGTEYVCNENGVLLVEIKGTQNFTLEYAGEEESVVASFTFKEIVVAPQQ